MSDFQRGSIQTVMKLSALLTVTLEEREKGDSSVFMFFNSLPLSISFLLSELPIAINYDTHPHTCASLQCTYIHTHRQKQCDGRIFQVNANTHTHTYTDTSMAKQIKDQWLILFESGCLDDFTFTLPTSHTHTHTQLTL